MKFRYFSGLSASGPRFLSPFVSVSVSPIIPVWCRTPFLTCSNTAPRFIAKYWSSVYQPLDKDIVREMWVQGTLKDDLGLKHRKARRVRSGSGSPLESAPMFHNRSLSELEIARDAFDHSSPELDTTEIAIYPPMNQVTDPIQPEQTQYVITSHQPPSQLPPLSLPQDPRQQMTVSPQLSYYSASDIPSPSPLPSPQYQDPAGLASNPPTESRRLGNPVSRTSPEASTSPIPISPLPPQPNSSMLTVPHTGGRAAYTNNSAYEMRVRTSSQNGGKHPPSAFPVFHQGSIQRTPSEMSHASSASFVSANSDFSDDERGTTLVARSQPPSQLPLPYEERQPTTLLEDDRSTLRDHARRMSESTSMHSSATTWEGPQAL